MRKTKGLNSGGPPALDALKKKIATGQPQDFIPANEHLDLRAVLPCITVSFSAIPVYLAKSAFAIWKSKATGIVAMTFLPKSDQSISDDQTQP